MDIRCFNYFIIGFLCLFYLPSTGQAGSVDQQWQLWLQAQVEQQPDVLSARKSMDAALAFAEGHQRAMYNPEFATEYERNGEDDVYSVGLSHTVDFWGKRGVRTSQADFMREAAHRNYNLVVQEKMAEVLQTIVGYQSSKELAGFTEKQEAQMDTLLRLVEKRSQAGDMGQADVELAFLGLTTRLNTTAQAKANLRQMEFRLSELLPDWSDVKNQIPLNYWDIQGRSFTSQELDLLPAVAVAKAEYKIAEHQAKLVRLEGKADPTFGLSAGEDGEEDVVGVSFSIPLNFRNNYRAEAQASSLESSSAKLRYRAVKRQAHFAAKAALSGFEEYSLHYRRWQTLVKGRGDISDTLLEQQWDSGDLSTSEYLLALDQIIESRVAGVELRTQFHLACIDWLLASGQLGAQAERVN